MLCVFDFRIVMDSRKLCEPCYRTSKYTFAVKYCSDCEEFLCSECAVYHSKFKAFLSHHVVDVNVTSDQSFVGSNECPTHKDMTLDLFCSDHDSICCKSCIANMHRTCENIKSLDVAANGVIHSSMYEELAMDMVSLNNAATQLTDEWKTSKVAWGTSKKDVKSAVEKFKAKILKRINEIEEKLMHEIDAAKPGSKLDKLTVDKQVEEIQDVLKQFNFVTKHGSEDQIFRLINTMKTNVPRMFNDMTILISSQASSRLLFEESNILSMFESLGSITVKTNPFDVKFNPHKNQQAHEMVQTIPPMFQFENSIPIIDEDGVIITGIGVIDDDRLLLCNYLTSQLYLLSIEQQNLTRIDLSSSSWGIVVKEGEDEALVTLPKEEYIQVVNTATMTLARTIKCPDGCRGITLIDKDIALGRTSEVCIINKEGTHIRSITLGCEHLQSLYSGNDRKLFYCDPNNGKLHCVNVDGTMVFSYSFRYLEYPSDVAVDVQGNSYVIGRISNNLHRISPNGKSMGIMLNESDGLKLPGCITFNKQYSKLYIFNDGSDQLLTFSCQ